MSVDAWLTLVAVIGVIVGLVTERLPAPVVVLAGVTALLVFGVLAPEEAFVGFANPAPITVAALFVFARAVEATGALDGLTNRALPTAPRSERSVLLRLTLPTAVSSAFLNNTPIVAMLAPRVAAWAKRIGSSPSRYLMPLSFATIVGGLMTLVGTSTNLVVSGLLIEEELGGLGMFELARFGLPLTVVAIAVLIATAPLLLPTRRSPGEDVSRAAREFTIEMVVADGGLLPGQSVSQAGLRNLRGVFLVELDRNGRTIAPVGPDERLEAGDRLVFAGNVHQIVDLQRMPGLRPAEHHHFQVAGTDPDRRFLQAVVAEGSPLAGATLKDIGFRARYGAAVLAIHRSGERVPGKLGEVQLRAGDVLLVLAHGEFADHWRDHHDFALVAPLEGTRPQRPEKAVLVQATALALLAVVATGLLDILVASLLVAIGLVLARVVSLREARASVDTDVIVLIAASFGLGRAIEQTGLASVFADGLTSAFGTFGEIGMLAGVLVATMALTGLISNNAAAVLMFPIAIATASAAGLDPRPFAIAVAIGASADFLTPIGYQTNTMVYGMGGYRFTDFARAGFPLTIVTIATALLVIPLAWPLR